MCKGIKVAAASRVRPWTLVVVPPTYSKNFVGCFSSANRVLLLSKKTIFNNNKCSDVTRGRGPVPVIDFKGGKWVSCLRPQVLGTSNCFWFVAFFKTVVVFIQWHRNNPTAMRGFIRFKARGEGAYGKTILSSPLTNDFQPCSWFFGK